MNSKHKGSDTTISIVGGLLLWVGWLFFNCASGYEIVDIAPNAIPQMIAINTFIAPSSSAITYCLIEFSGSYFSQDSSMHVIDPCKIMNAILAGLVAITASCNNVDKWAATVIGIVSIDLI